MNICAIVYVYLYAFNLYTYIYIYTYINIKTYLLVKKTSQIWRWYFIWSALHASVTTQLYP